MPTVFQRVGPYEILREIGRGGMAVVFLATDSRTGLQVALKLVPTGTDREAHEILDAERWGAKLQEQFCRVSRHVPVVYEHDTEGGYFYIAMEYLGGRNLSEVITDGPLAPERAVRIAIELCHFLEAAHAFEATIEGRQLRSLLHGDLKPRNIRVLDGPGGDEIKVLDFGIAKALSLSRKVTRNDFGSIAYLSPERLESESGEIDAHADFWAVGVLLYEMVAGVQPFRAPDTRRLEQRIKSLRPAAPLDAPCPPGLQAIVAKLLTGNRADRYSNARAIRDDLECLEAGQETQAQREGWLTRAQDEPPTRRTQPPKGLDEEATRRTSRGQAGLQTTTPSAGEVSSGAAAARATRGSGNRFLRTALLLLVLFVIGNELRVARSAERLTADVPTLELDRVGQVWDQYDALKAGSLSIGVMGLERALTSQTEALADRVIGNYRTPLPAVRETQWRMAREALAHALTANPADRQLRGALRYCDGHLHRINGDAFKARNKAAEAQREFTDAVAAFREAAELRPNWPDPFLGLMRTFIYGLEDVDRGADALKQAQSFGYTAGDRETAQLADGYRSRAESLARTARTLSGMAQEEEYLTRAAEAYRQALDLYSKVLGFAGVPRNMRVAQSGLKQVEQRIADLSRDADPTSAPQNRSSLFFQSHDEVAPWA